jgi:hypothetical protein
MTLSQPASAEANSSGRKTMHLYHHTGGVTSMRRHKCSRPCPVEQHGSEIVGIKGAHHAERAEFLSGSLSSTYYYTHHSQIVIRASTKVTWVLLIKLATNTLQHSGQPYSTPRLSSIGISSYCSTITSHCHHVYHTRLLSVLPFRLISHQRSTEARLLLPAPTTLWPHLSIAPRSSR